VRRRECSDLLRERADFDVRRGEFLHDVFPLHGEVHEVAPDREKALSRDLRAGGLDHRAPHDDAVLCHERALGMQRGERERVVHGRDDEGVGQRGCRRSRGLRGEELACDPDDARVLRPQRKRRLGQRVDETRRAEFLLAHGSERGVERGAGLEDGRFEG
jgi:hypothetical protein